MEPAETGEDQQEAAFWVCLSEPSPSVCPSVRRYLDCLKKNIKKGPFERHEVELLEQLVKKHGVGEVLMMMMMMNHLLFGSELTVCVSGRWAKIAAEIPHRLDAQCLREWRKLVREPAQVNQGSLRGDSGVTQGSLRGQERRFISCCV